jgi:hypothetical protein
MLFVVVHLIALDQLSRLAEPGENSPYLKNMSHKGGLLLALLLFMIVKCICQEQKKLAVLLCELHELIYSPTGIQLTLQINIYEGTA